MLEWCLAQFLCDLSVGGGLRRVAWRAACVRACVVCVVLCVLCCVCCVCCVVSGRVGGVVFAFVFSCGLLCDRDPI